MSPSKTPPGAPFPTPHVLVSRCLGFDACRYNGEGIPDKFIDRLRPFVRFQTVCPEVQIGLGVPRDPIHLESQGGRTRLVQPSTSKDLTEAMTAFAGPFLSSLRDVDGVILKSRSPSCGVRDVKLRRGNGGPAIGRGAGMFGGMVLDRFPDAPVEDEARLSNRRLREDFLTKIFLWARFRRVRKSGAHGALVRFHAAHKLLLMAYSPKGLVSLGNIAANHAKKPFPDVAADYEKALGGALSTPPSAGRHINVLMHALGYVSDELAPAEKNHFLSALEEYRRRRLPLSGPLSVFRSWLARFHTPYLRDQVYFDPFPSALSDLEDSGKDRA